MSREVRRVPADWEHPVKADRGNRDGWRPFWVPMFEDEMSETIGDRPCTHWQMYETTSEGTPISPVMDSPESLARWLVVNNATVFGRMTGSYDQWLAMITGSGATVGAVLGPDGFRPGWLD